MKAIKGINLLDNFKCLGEKCPDNCCSGFSVFVDNLFIEKAKANAPELLDTITQRDNEFIFKTSSTCGKCVNFEDGLCGIHKKYGEDTLADICYSYPRVFKKLNGEEYMSTTFSCPEVVRLYFEHENFAESLDYKPMKKERLPIEITNVSNDVKSEDILAVMTFFKGLILSAKDSLEAMRKVFYFSNRLKEYTDNEWWFIIKDLQSKHNNFDEAALNVTSIKTFDIINIVAMVIISSKNSKLQSNLNIIELVKVLESYYAVKVADETFDVTYDSNLFDLKKILNNRNSKELETIDTYLKKWLLFQTWGKFFPFGGQGKNLSERCMVLAIKYIALRLMLIGISEKRHETFLTFEICIQVFAKILDHHKEMDHILEYMQIYSLRNYNRIMQILHEVF